MSYLYLFNYLNPSLSQVIFISFTLYIFIACGYGGSNQLSELKALLFPPFVTSEFYFFELQILSYYTVLVRCNLYCIICKPEIGPLHNY